MPLGPAFPRAHDRWKRLQLTHKRPTDQPMSLQLFVLDYLRFALSGDLAGAWKEFGGLAAQWTHLGTLLAIDTTENAMTAMSYGRSIRQTIMTNSRKRMSTGQQKKMITMLTEERDAAIKAIIRELTAESSAKTTDKVAIKSTGKGDPSRRKNKGQKGHKGKCQKGKWQSQHNDRNFAKGKGKRRQF